MAGSIRFFTAGPAVFLAIIIIVGVVLLLIPVVFVGMSGAAITRLGLSWFDAVGLVLLMLAGSFFNGPLYRIRRDVVRAIALDSSGTGLFGNHGTDPVWETTVSVNIGGAIVPVGTVAYMIYRENAPAAPFAFVPALMCILLVACLTFVFTRRAAGTGIRVPLIIPALVALLAGLLLSGGTGLHAAITALSGGVIGVLAGGNIAWLPRVREIETAEFSIGGGGTFGSVFLCCVLPALIA